MTSTIYNDIYQFLHIRIEIVKVLLPLVFFFLYNYDFINTMWESLSFTYIDNMELSIADYLIEVQFCIPFFVWGS